MSICQQGRVLFQVRLFSIMAVTRARLALNGTKDVSVESNEAVQLTLKESKVSLKSSTAIKVTKPKSNRKPKKHIEELFPPVEVPSDLLLPTQFVDYHTPEFVDGIRFILQKDPSLYPCIVYQNFPAFAQEEIHQETESETILRYWYALIRSVIGQQVSGHAAKAIEGRFRDLFDGEPTPQAVLEKSPEELRAVGLLAMKLKYVTSISEAFGSASNVSSLDFYKSSSNDEIIKELVQLNGIGEWSAKMFSVFTLKELDIFAYDDLGVARGVARYLENRPQLLKDIKDGVNAVEELKMGLKRKGKFMGKSNRNWTPLHDQYVKFLGAMHSPYQLVFMLIMWRLAATNIEVLEKPKD